MTHFVEKTLKTLRLPLILVIAAALSGCATQSVAPAFSSPVIRNFNEDVLRQTQLYKDTTSTPELRQKYKNDWLAIQLKINEYEYELEKSE